MNIRSSSFLCDNNVSTYTCTRACKSDGTDCVSLHLNCTQMLNIWHNDQMTSEQTFLEQNKLMKPQVAIFPGPKTLSGSRKTIWNHTFERFYIPCWTHRKCWHQNKMLSPSRNMWFSPHDPKQLTLHPWKRTAAAGTFKMDRLEDVPFQQHDFHGGYPP